MGCWIGEEQATQGDRSDRGAFLPNAADHHTEMLRFDHHGQALRAKGLSQCIRYLLTQTLLDLESSRESFHYAGDLADSDEMVLRKIGHVAVTDEREEMMLADAAYRYVPNGNEARFAAGEDRFGGQGRGIQIIPGRELAPRASDTLWCCLKRRTERSGLQVPDELRARSDQRVLWIVWSCHVLQLPPEVSQARRWPIGSFGSLPVSTSENPAYCAPCSRA